METIKPIFLIGYRCTGKSTTGKLLASHLDCLFFDTDRIIEEQSRITIAQMVDQKGWEYFRQQERQTLLDKGRLANCVIATGGGIVLDPENCRFIQTHGICVWLYADADTIVNRLISDDENYESRPRFSKGSLSLETKKTLEFRSPLYQSLGQIKIDTGCHSPKEAANIIKRRVSHVRQ